MGPEGAVNIVFRNELSGEGSDARRSELIADYRERFANPYVAAERGYVDDVIEPRRTRPVLIDALETALSEARAAPQAQAREHPALTHARVRTGLRPLRGRPPRFPAGALDGRGVPRAVAPGALKAGGELPGRDGARRLRPSREPLSQAARVGRRRARRHREPCRADRGRGGSGAALRHRRLRLARGIPRRSTDRAAGTLVRSGCCGLRQPADPPRPSHRDRRVAKPGAPDPQGLRAHRVQLGLSRARVRGPRRRCHASGHLAPRLSVADRSRQCAAKREAPPAAREVVLAERHPPAAPLRSGQRSSPTRRCWPAASGPYRCLHRSTYRWVRRSGSPAGSSQRRGRAGRPSSRRPSAPECASVSQRPSTVSTSPERCSVWVASRSRPPEPTRWPRPVAELSRTTRWGRWDVSASRVRPRPRSTMSISCRTGWLSSSGPAKCP